MKDGDRYTGWIRAFSDGTSERSLLLEKVKQYDEDGDNFDWPLGESLYLPTLSEVQYLRFIPKEKLKREQPQRPSQGTKPAPNGGDRTDQGTGNIKHEPRKGSSRPAPGVADQTG